MVRGEIYGRYYGQLYVDEVTRAKFDPECDVNGSPSHSACRRARSYAESNRLGQENCGPEPLPAEINRYELEMSLKP